MKSGTKEWAEVNKNCFTGCEHNCRYCYARSNAIRFKWIRRAEDWERPKINHKKFDEKPKQVKGRIMFPTQHDITPNTVNQCIDYLRGWLDHDNEFLIVSKPHLDVVTKLCDAFEGDKDMITFRFTIGSQHDSVLEFWEPSAPGFEERFDALKHAHSLGFNTSVSCEPFLDEDIADMVYQLLPYVTDTIWIGKMNRIPQRVSKVGWTNEEFRHLETLELIYNIRFIAGLYEKLKDNPKIRWKESIQKVLNLEEYKGVG